MKTLGKIFAVIITLVISVLISLLKTYVVLDVAELFNIAFILQFSFAQVFGILFIIGLFVTKFDSNNDSKDFVDGIINIFAKQILMITAILISWVLVYLVYNLFLI